MRALSVSRLWDEPERYSGLGLRVQDIGFRECGAVLHSLACRLKPDTHTEVRNAYSA